MAYPLQHKIGDTTTTKEGYLIKIVSREGINITVKFENGHQVIVQPKEYKSGAIRNPYHKNIYGIGFIGHGKHKSSYNLKDNPAYVVWTAMFQRCYYKKHISAGYEKCTVGEKWHNFQDFADWYEENFIDGFQLDKDILVKDNNIYNPDNCCFVPREINMLFCNKKSKNKLPIGVHFCNITKKYISQIRIDGKGKYLGSYIKSEEAFISYKLAKEKEIKRLDEKWKDRIKENVYNAMINYEI